jgi:hypothetical protein
MVSFVETFLPAGLFASGWISDYDLRSICAGLSKKIHYHLDYKSYHMDMRP